MRRVFLHVGAPKTGTTFIQDMLWTNRAQLLADGVCYPLAEWNDHLFATLDLLQRPWGGRFDAEWHGRWSTVVDRARRTTASTVVFSNELLGLATADKVERITADFQPAEVHVVVTARDLARQLPSDWQEQVKHSHTVTLDRFVDDLVTLGLDAPRPFGELFWGLHDVAHVLRHWSKLPPERVHVITIPQAGHSVDTLWRRFAGLIGVLNNRYEPVDVRTNHAMGAVEAEFLRRFNIVSRDLLTSDQGPTVNMILGQRILGGRSERGPIRLPERHYSWVAARSEQMANELAGGGYDVIGDLRELLVAEPGPIDVDTRLDSLPPGALMQTAFFAVAGLVRELQGLRAYSRRLTELLSEADPESLAQVLDGRAADGEAAE